MGLVRILAVEDFWGCHSQPVLRESTESEILGEDADGPEAIRMSAEQLQLDLVLSDIKLPELNGLDAARKIQQVSPPRLENRVRVPRVESSHDYGGAETWRAGFVSKLDRADGLLPAVRTALCL